MVGGEDIEYGWHWSSIQLNNGVDISSTYLFNAVTREVVDQYTIVVCLARGPRAFHRNLLTCVDSRAIITAYNVSRDVHAALFCWGSITRLLTWPRVRFWLWWLWFCIHFADDTLNHSD